MRVALTLVFLVAATAPVVADEPFAIHDRGDQVEIVARGWTAVDPSRLTVTRERIELMVAGGAKTARTSSEDPTVRRVEVRGRDPRVLSIKLRFDHDRVVALAARATAEQVGDEIRVTIPRTLRAAPARTAVAATPAVPAEPPTPAVAAPPPPAVEAAPAAEPAAPIAPAIAAPIGQPGSGGPRRWLILLGGLALIAGGAAAFVRRRKPTAPTHDRIEVIDSRPVGGKARVVWLGAGDRELVVAVGPQQVRLLGQWRRREPSDATTTYADEPRGAFARGSTPKLRAMPSSPAVSGILRLRDRPGPLADDIASGDPEADEQWAKDILAATGGRR